MYQVRQCLGFVHLIFGRKSFIGKTCHLTTVMHLYYTELMPRLLVNPVVIVMGTEIIKLLSAVVDLAVMLSDNFGLIVWD